MRVAVCFRGQLRTYKHTLENLKRFFNTIDNGNATIDYFYHTWNDNLYFPSDGHKLSAIENNAYELADYDKTFLEKQLNPKMYIIEDYNKYKRRSTTIEHWGAIFYSIFQVNELKKKYEKINKFTYDLVINTRFDLVFPLTAKFPDLKLHENTGYSFMPMDELTGEEGYRNFDDMIFYGSSNSIDIITKIYPKFILPELNQKRFDSYFNKNENWNDVPEVYRLGPGSLLYSYMNKKEINYSNKELRSFLVARKEVETKNLDGIKDYSEIRKLHLDYYKKNKFKVIKDNFAMKSHCLNINDESEFGGVFYPHFQKGQLDTSNLKFTTYANSQIHKLIKVDLDLYDHEIPDDAFNDKEFICIYPLFVALHLPWHSSLETLPSNVLQACRENRLWILFENLLEGDTVPPAEWSSLHLTLQKLGLPPRNIIFTNNDFNLTFSYDEWFKSQDLFEEKIKAIFIPYDILNIPKLISDGLLYEEVKFDTLFKYKSKNIDKCKHFLKINRTPRNERIAASIYLMENDILKNTKLSCTEYLWDNNDKAFDHFSCLNSNTRKKFKNLLPLGTSKKDLKNTGMIGLGNNFFDPNKPYEISTYLDTFISIVSTPFPRNQNEMHLHCSTYNPMYNMQPIIQYGPLHALGTLKELGFKTFDKWWSEKYDFIEDDSFRLLEVLKVVKKINKLSKQEMLEMYLDMKSTLIYNYNLLKSFEGKFDIGSGIKIKSNGKYNS